MSRIAACMQKLQSEGRKALVPYVVGGDPVPQVTVPVMHAMVKAGADIIELGVPFSDPMAEGPVIQLGHERALEANTSLRDIFAMVKQFRETDTDTPVVIMGYANPIEVMGYAAFAAAASDAGIDGVLTVDLPPEEAQGLNEELKKADIDIIFLLAPTTSEARIQSITAMATGYVYYVSLKGVTGAGNLDIESVRDKMAVIQRFTDLPVCVGFGIKDPESASKISSVADGAVVGSVLVNKMGELAARNASQQEIETAVADILAGMRQAMDATAA